MTAKIMEKNQKVIINVKNIAFELFKPGENCNGPHFVGRKTIWCLSIYWKTIRKGKCVGTES